MGVGVGDNVGNGVRVIVGVFEGRGVMVLAGVVVWVGVGVCVMVGVRVWVGVGVIVAVLVIVGDSFEPQPARTTKAAVRSSMRIALLAGFRDITSFQRFDRVMTAAP